MKKKQSIFLEKFHVKAELGSYYMNVLCSVLLRVAKSPCYMYDLYSGGQCISGSFSEYSQNAFAQADSFRICFKNTKQFD